MFWMLATRLSWNATTSQPKILTADRSLVCEPRKLGPDNVTGCLELDTSVIASQGSSSLNLPLTMTRMILVEMSWNRKRQSGMAACCGCRLRWSGRRTSPKDVAYSVVHHDPWSRRPQSHKVAVRGIERGSLRN